MPNPSIQPNSIVTGQSSMPAPFVGTPYKTEDGAFEYPFPTPPLPVPPYQPTSANPTSATSVQAIQAAHANRPDSPANKMTSKMVKEGPIPPGLITSTGALALRRGSRTAPNSA